MRLLHAVVQALLDVLFPPRCVHCGAGGALFCPACLATVRVPDAPRCNRCGRSLPSTVLTGTGSCAACASGHGPAALTILRVAAVYTGALRTAVIALKFNGQRRLAEPLGDMLAETIRREGLRPDAIVPVPLHAVRRRARGYNQSDLLARRCAARLGIPCESKALVRIRATPPQVGLTAPQRRTNVAGAFAPGPPAVTARLTGKRVLVIDDVTTTGSTLDAAAAALVALRPAALWGLAVARPDLDDDPYDVPVASGARRSRSIRPEA